ncbi:MAG: putative porin [Chlorobium sp.]|nr:putative porin [Chlorobium sp.]
MKKVAMIVGLAAALGFNHAEAADWNWKGDLRYRYQSDLTSNPAATGEHSRDRYRTRVRVGVYPWINEELTGGVQLATGGAGTETTSRNETLDDQFLPDQVYLNEYFINYHPIALDGKVNILLGKRDVANTLMVVNDLVWDSDLAFEGMTLQYGKDVDGKDKEGINAIIGYYPLNELKSTTIKEQDAYLLVGQAAYSGEVNDLTYQVGAGYYNYVHFDVDNDPSTVYSPVYDYTGKDFNIVELFGSLGGQITEKTPWKVTVQYAFNTAKNSARYFNIDNEKRTSYLAGIKIGNAKEVGQWSLGTDYVKIEQDALTVLTDSDRNMGITKGTNLEGVKVSGVFHLVQNMTVGATYFKFNTIDDPTLKKQHALMADVVIKF